MKLNHIHLKVSNLERAKKFYIEMFGFKVREQLGPYLFLHLGDEHHALALQERENASIPEENTLGLYHVALEVENEEAFQEILKKVQKHKIPHTEVDHTISKTVYFSDPDENGLEIMIDTRKQKDQVWKGKNR